MKRALLLVCALVLTSACSYVVPQSNELPRAYITSISPAELTEGETVRFVGYGTDVDGEVVGYRWRSSLDGELSRLPEFETDSLSVGDHAVYFMVQDGNDGWSTEVQGSVTVLAAAAPVEVDFFGASLTSIEPGDSVTLSWTTSKATAVSIVPGIGSVAASGSKVVTPDVSTTYTLIASGGGATVTAEVTVEVEESGPELEIVFFEADPEAVPSGHWSTLSWETTGATEVRITPLSGEVLPVGSMDVILSGDGVHTFTLIATDGESTITADVEIESYVVVSTSHTVTLTAVIGDSGYVRSTLVPWPNYIYVGDDNDDIGLQGFMTFDISDIPGDAVIDSVVVDMSNHESTYGLPFGSGNLGNLFAFVDDYGTLDGGDYTAYPTAGAIGVWHSQGELDVSGGGYTDPFADALQDKVGEDRFQVRLQFGLPTDGELDNDLVRWQGTKLPKLIVTYFSYE